MPYACYIEYPYESFTALARWLDIYRTEGPNRYKLILSGALGEEEVYQQPVGFNLNFRIRDIF